MTLVRAVLATLVLLGLSAAPAAAVCNRSAVCSATQLETCCQGLTCTLDGAVDVRQDVPCTLDFGPRKVVVSGTLTIGSGTVFLRAAALSVTTGLIDASGDTGRSGGTLTITTTGGATPAFALTTPQARIDLCGSRGCDANAPGSGDGGTLTVHADGPVALVGGNIRAIGYDPDAEGGEIAIDTTAGDVSIGARLLADGGLYSAGGSVEVQSAGTLTVLASLSVEGGALGGGLVQLQAAPTALLKVASDVPIDAHAFAGSGGDGGEVLLEGGSVQMLGHVLASADGSDATGGAATLWAHAGALTVAGDGIAADGDVGEVTLQTDTPGTGNIVVLGPISAQGQGTVDSFAGGGNVFLTAAGDLTVARRLNVSGLGGGTGEILVNAGGDVALDQIVGNDPGGGARIDVVSGGATTFGADVDLRATADPNALETGGDLQVVAGDTIAVGTAHLDVTGESGDGGSVVLAAQGGVTVAQSGQLLADAGAADGLGGVVAVLAGTRCATGYCDPLAEGLHDLAGDVRIDGKLFARGHATSGTAGIRLAGCAIRFGDAATVDSSGNAQGTNQITARTGLTLEGRATVKAGSANVATLPEGVHVVLGRTAPQPTITEQPAPRCAPADAPQGCLMPCPACGNGTAEYPEQCDPGHPGSHHCEDAATDCTSHCRTVPCDDDHECTSDRCDDALGCTHTPLTGRTDIPGCSDANPCNGVEICAQVAPGVPPSCYSPPPPCPDDHNDCTLDCDPATGACLTDQPIGDGTSCRDAERCNGIERCSGTTCAAPVSGPDAPVTCASATDICIEPDGHCAPKPCLPTGPACPDDGNPCTRETCAAGPCTGGFCCTRTLLSGSGIPDCDDGNPCNGVEACVPPAPDALPRCTHPVGPDCDDDDPCTADTCDETTGGCRHAAIAGCCRADSECPDDHNVCTDDLGCDLSRHVCVHAPIARCCVTSSDCDDGNPCTADGTCGADHRCPAPAPLNGPQSGCGDACTIMTCVTGTCTLVRERDCTAELGDDGDPCTVEVCDRFDAAQPCSRVPKSAPECCHTAAECDDHKSCTTDDCVDHRCTNAYTRRGCRECGTGAVTDTQCNSPCAAVPEQCSTDHECVDTVATNCDDHDPETNDTCVVDDAGNPTCRHRCGPTTCDDANACTTDTCTAATGACSHAPVACDDRDLCVVASCDPAHGCVTDPRQGAGAVTCHLDMIDRDLAAAGSADVSGTVRTKLAKSLHKIRSTIAAAAASTGRKALKLRSSTAKQLRALDRLVTAAARKKKPQIAAALAGVIRTQITGATSALATALVP
ncbi:MAG: hypothetical protein U0807_17385 [Candidatus Binatia bacterium]